MSSESVAPAASAESAEPHEDLTRELSNMLPSWLLSLVVHLSLVLVLALVVIGDGGLSQTTIELNCETSGSEGQGDAMLAAVELPSELDTAELEEPPVPTDITSVEPAKVDINLIDPTGSIGKAGLEAGLSGDSGPEIASPVNTAVFGLSAEGERFVYVFDRSKSMNSTLVVQSEEGETLFTVTPLEAAKAELLRSLKDLGRGQQFHIIFYNDEVWMFDPGGNPNHLVEATNQYKYRATEFVRSVYGHGGTRHIKPLEIALRMKPDVIFLLTDGEEKDDPTEAQLRDIRRLNRGRAKINVIQFCVTPRTTSSLVRLAKQNDGKHVFMNIGKLAPGLATAAAK